MSNASSDTTAPIVLLPSQACNGPHFLVTILSWNASDVQRPAFYTLTDNYISQRSSQLVPDFVRTFEKFLYAKRSPELGVSLVVCFPLHAIDLMPFQMDPNHLLLLKNFLGDEGYDKYFTDPSSDSPGRSMMLLEMLHYSCIFYDELVTSLKTYTTSKGLHLYDLLRRLSALEGGGSICLYVLTNFQLNPEI